MLNSLTCLMSRYMYSMPTYFTRQKVFNAFNGHSQ